MERTILTEPTSAFLLASLLVALIALIYSKRIVTFVSLLIFILLFLLHPTFVFLPLILFPILIWYLYKSKHLPSVWFILFNILVFYGIVGWYISQNNLLYGYQGISTISMHNLLAKTIQYKLSTDSIPNKNEYTRQLKHCISQYDPNTVFDIIDCMKLLNINDGNYAVKSAPIVGEFAKDVILNNISTYMIRSLELIPIILTTHFPDPIYLYSTDSKNPQLEILWQKIYSFFVRLQTLTAVFLVLYPIQIYLFLKNPTKKRTFVILMGTISFYIVATSAFFSFINYVRLRHPVEIPLYLFCVYSLYDLFFVRQKKKLYGDKTK